MLHIHIERDFINLYTGTLGNSFSFDKNPSDPNDKKDVLYSFVFDGLRDVLQRLVEFLYLNISKLDEISKKQNFDFNVDITIRVRKISPDKNEASLIIRVIPSLEENWFVYTLNPLLFKKFYGGEYKEAGSELSGALNELITSGWNVYGEGQTLKDHTQTTLYFGGIEYTEKF